MKKPATRPQGRPTLPLEKSTRPYSVRMTDAENAKFIALGGAVWLRNKIKRSPLPAPKETK